MNSRKTLFGLLAFAFLLLAGSAYAVNPLKGVLLIFGTLAFLGALLLGIIKLRMNLGQSKVIMLLLTSLSLASVVALQNAQAVIPGTQDYRNACLLNGSSNAFSISGPPASGWSYSAPCTTNVTNPNYHGLVAVSSQANDQLFGDVWSRAHAILTDNSFTVPSNSMWTITGDYYMYGYVHVEGQAAIGGTFSPVASVVVSLNLVGPSSFSWTLLRNELGQSDCGGTAVLSVINCYKTNMVSGDLSFSETGLLTPGAYTLNLRIDTYAEVQVGALAGSTAMSCFSPDINCVQCPSSSCTDVPPSALPPTTLDPHLSSLPGSPTIGAPGYYAQWKYTTYTFTNSYFTISQLPNNSMYQGTSLNMLMTLASINGFSGIVTLAGSAPAGITAVPNPSSVTLSGGGTASSILVLTVPSTVSLNTYPITVTGNGNGVTQSMTFYLTILDPTTFGGGGCGGGHRCPQ